MQVSLGLNEGMDSFARMVNYLRRKKIGIKSIDMKAMGDSTIHLDMVFGDGHSSKYIMNSISKLEDVEVIKIS